MPPDEETTAAETPEGAAEELAPTAENPGTLAEGEPGGEAEPVAEVAAADLGAGLSPEAIAGVGGSEGAIPPEGAAPEATTQPQEAAGEPQSGEAEQPAAESAEGSQEPQSDESGPAALEPEESPPEPEGHPEPVPALGGGSSQSIQDNVSNPEEPSTEYRLPTHETASGARVDNVSAAVAAAEEAAARAESEAVTAAE